MRPRARRPRCSGSRPSPTRSKSMPGSPAAAWSLWSAVLPSCRSSALSWRPRPRSRSSLSSARVWSGLHALPFDLLDPSQECPDLLVDEVAFGGLRGGMAGAMAEVRRNLGIDRVLDCVADAADALDPEQPIARARKDQGGGGNLRERNGHVAAESRGNVVSAARGEAQHQRIRVPAAV